MKRQHGGWASQAKRRQEEYVGCVSCGMKEHPRQQAYPDDFGDQVGRQDGSVIRILGLIAFVLLMYAVIIYCLPIVLEAVVH